MIEDDGVMGKWHMGGGNGWYSGIASDLHWKPSVEFPPLC